METNILAKIGDLVITREDMLAVLRGMPKEQAESMNTFEGRQSLLSEMIAAELLYLEAKENGFEQDAEYITLVENTAHSLLQQYAIQKLVKDVQVTPADVKAYYLANADSFQKEEEVKARHILVAEEELATQIVGEIKAGLEFSEAATKYSTCPSKERGGDLGFFSRNRMVKEFEEAAFALEIGVLSEPVQTQFGYHIIITDEKKDAQNMSFEEVEAQIQRTLMQEAQFKIYEEKIGVLKDLYPVEVNDELLK
ncbi:MAG: peptidylprolyl isomerase [Vallitaleaceae bacterium]|nr:peptidylprolyl isomerase [Vallitaleaceae bacterium]